MQSETVQKSSSSALPLIPHFAILNLDRDTIDFRGISDNGTIINQPIILAPRTNYRLFVLQAETQSDGYYDFQTLDSGLGIGLGDIEIVSKNFFDTDEDGLSNTAEYIIGSVIDDPDTDGDGIDDLAEIQQGLDPLGGQGFPTGVIASIPLEGETREVTIENSFDAEAQNVYVATGSHGLAIVDGSEFSNPIVLGQLDLEGNNIDVAVDSNLQIAAIASGIAYVADDSGGLSVGNYLPFDSQGQAPTVTIDASVPDFDSNTSGIQVIEGTTIPILTTVTDDVQVRDVELLVNGEVVNRDISFPFDFSVPTFDRINETVEVQVRATDTGGNSAVSNVLSFGIVEDTFAPEIVSTNPLNNGVSVNLSEIKIDFNEEINPNQINLAAITLTNLGDDTNIPIEAVDSPFGNDLVITLASSLEEGNYQLTVVPSIIADNAGNILESEISLTFTNNSDPGEEFADALDIGVLGETQIFEEFVGTEDRRDIYQFTLDEISQVDLNLTGLTEAAQLSIATDFDGDGILDNGETIEGDGVLNSSASTADRNISRILNPGVYSIVIFTNRSDDNTNYTLSAAATATPPSNDIDPGQELNEALDIGVLGETQTFTDAVGSLDRRDFYQFTLDEISEVDLNLTGLTEAAQLSIATDFNGFPVI
ncbi:MAG: Ig-like domain-containing protein [Cyanobacteria bacterium J06592_8]